MASVKTAIRYMSNAFESYRHKREIDPKRHQEAVLAFLEDIYGAITTDLEDKYKDYFPDVNVEGWKQDHDKILARWSSAVRDANKNTYLDISWNAIKGAMLLYIPERFFKSNTLTVRAVIDAQTEGAYTYNGMLSPKSLDPGKMDATTRDQTIAKLPKVIQEAPYDLAVAGKYLDQKYGGARALSRNDLQELAKTLTAYLTAYYTNAGILVDENISETSEVSDFKEDKSRRALINCAAFASIGAAFFEHILNGQGEESKFEIDRGTISGKGAAGHALTFAHYKNHLTDEETILVVDNSNIHFIPLEKGDDAETKLRQFAAATWFPIYDKSAPVQFTIEPVIQYDNVARTHRKTSLPVSAKSGTFEVKLDDKAVSFRLALPTTAELKEEIHIDGVHYTTTTEMMNDGQVFYTIVDMNNSQTTFGLYNPWTEEVKYSLPSIYRMPRSEMVLLVTSLDDMRQYRRMGALQQVTQVLRDTRDVSLRLRLLDICFETMKETGFLAGVKFYFQNPTVSPDEFEAELRRFALFPRHPEKDFFDHEDILASAHPNAKIAFRRIGVALTEKGRAQTERESEFGAFALGAYLAEEWSRLSDQEYDDIFNRLLLILQESENVNVCQYILKLLLRQYRFHEDAKRNAEKIAAAVAAPAFLRHLQGNTHFDAIRNLYEVYDLLAHDGIRTPADSFLEQYAGVIVTSYEELLCNDDYSPDSAFKDMLARTYARLERLHGALSPQDMRTFTVHFATFVVATDQLSSPPSFSDDIVQQLVNTLNGYHHRSPTENALRLLLLMRLQRHIPITEEFYRSSLSSVWQKNTPQTLVTIFIALSEEVAWSPAAATLVVRDFLGSNVLRNGDAADACKTLVSLLSSFVQKNALSPKEAFDFFQTYVDTFNDSKSCIVEAIEGFAHVNSEISAMIHKKNIVEKPEKHPAVDAPAGMVTYGVTELPSLDRGDLDAKIAAANAVCTIDGLDHAGCEQFGERLGANLQTLLQDFSFDDSLEDAEFALNRITNILALLDRNAAVRNAIEAENVILIGDEFDRLLDHPNRTIRDRMVAQLEVFLRSARQRNLQFPELENKGREMLQQSIPIGPVMRDEHLAAILQDDPSHERRKDAAAAIAYLLIRKKELEKLHGKEALPRAAVQRVQRLMALTESDTAQSVVDAGRRSVRLIEAVTESFRTSPQRVPCADGVEGNMWCYASVFDTNTKLPATIPALMDEGVNDVEATQRLTALNDFNHAFPYQQHAHYFYALELTSTHGDEAVRTMIDYPNPNDRSSAAYTLRVSPHATDEEIQAQMAYPAFGQAPSYVRDRFESVDFLDSFEVEGEPGSARKLFVWKEGLKEADEEFYLFWKEWLHDSKALWKKVETSYQQGDPYKFRKLLLMLQIMAFPQTTLAFFSQGKQIDSGKIEYSADRDSLISHITISEQTYIFSWDHRGTLSITKKPA